MLSKINNKNTDDNNLIDNNAIYKEIYESQTKGDEQ